MIQAKTFFGESGKQFIPGIHTDVEFGGLEITDKNAVAITFEKDGARVKQFLFEPTGTYPFGDESPEAAMKREQNNNLRHIIALMRTVLGDDVAYEVRGEDYDDFVQKASTLLNPHIGFKVNLKLLPGRREKQPVEVPRFPPKANGEGRYVEPYVIDSEATLTYTEREQEAMNNWTRDNS